MGTVAALGTVALVLLAVVATAWGLRRLRGRRAFASPGQHAAFNALHAASLAAPALRAGLSPDSAAAAVPHLRVLLGTAVTALTDEDGVLLAWTGAHSHHEGDVLAAAARAASTGRRELVAHDSVDCGRLDCEVRALVVVPLVPGDRGVAGVLCAAATAAVGPGLVRATAEVAHYAATQLELAELDGSRARVARAELRALRAQISPHFLYNALTTVASFVRTDPERARELVLEFADFTRYSFRAAGEFTTLADELRNIDRYLALERARFGARLNVVVRVAPEVLGVTLPFLALQPLVENAVRHGLAPKPDGGTLTVTAEDLGTQCLISVDDDGVGMDPQRLASAHDEPLDAGAHVGLRNVDDRLRAVFGDNYGLDVETAPGAGTRVNLRVPKFAPDVRP